MKGVESTSHSTSITLTEIYVNNVTNNNQTNMIEFILGAAAGTIIALLNIFCLIHIWKKEEKESSNLSENKE